MNNAIVDNNNNNIHICIAPYGRNFRGAGNCAPGAQLLHATVYDVKFKERGASWRIL